MKRKKKATKKKPRGKCGAPLDGGRKCQQVAGWGTRRKSGPCRRHTSKGTARLQDRKRAFLEVYQTGTSAIMAARMCDGWRDKKDPDPDAVSVWTQRTPRGGVDPATVWRWMQADPEFKAEYEKTRAMVDEMRPHLVEDLVFESIMAGEESGTTALRWLERMSRERWRPPTQDVRVNPKEELAKLLGCSPDELPDRLEVGADD